jgi:hypothetical protein
MEKRGSNILGLNKTKWRYKGKILLKETKFGGVVRKNKGME